MIGGSLTLKALAMLSNHSVGRRAVASVETFALGSMLARSKEAGPKGRALGSLFDRYEPGRSPREIYKQVFSPDRIEKGYRSQMAQDLFLDRWLFKQGGPGFFLDVGAYDGELGSNTYYFEKRLGWKGVALEPNPPMFEKLRARRSCQTLQACAYEYDGEVEFMALSETEQQRRTDARMQPPNLTSLVLDRDHGAVMLSGIQAHIDNVERVEKARETWHLEKSVIKVPCRRLDSILDEAGMSTVDYLSIDVEGAELQVMAGLDLNRIKVNVISVEASPVFPQVYSLLTDAGFEYHGLLFFDEVFVHRDCRFTWQQSIRQ